MIDSSCVVKGEGMKTKKLWCQQLITKKQKNIYLNERLQKLIVYNKIRNMHLSELKKKTLNEEVV